MNGALAGPIPLRRRGASPRVPVACAVSVVRGRRSVPARAYSVSTGGALIAMERPALRGTPVGLVLELPSGRARLAGRVIMTNVPGNLSRPNRPIGMAVRFGGVKAGTQAALDLAIEERAREVQPWRHVRFLPWDSSPHMGRWRPGSGRRRLTSILAG